MPAILLRDGVSSISQSSWLTIRDNGDDGGLKGTTKIGIAIGLICFFGLLFSFWLVARWRRSPDTSSVPSEEDEFTKWTFERWSGRFSAQPTNVSLPPGHVTPHSPRRMSNASSSTASTLISSRACQEPNLSYPPHAHTNSRR